MKITLIQPVGWAVNGLVTITVITTVMVHRLMLLTKAVRKGKIQRNELDQRSMNLKNVFSSVSVITTIF